MKNIHILPTDKPTGIFQSNSGLQFSIRDKVRVEPLKGFHIYITSDEEIKDGDWFVKTHNIRSGVFDEVFKSLSSSSFIGKKIILTTNQDLIKDGVQAIDDEFLEWFVNNPSCESVETYSLGIENSDTGESGHYKYEIIIQQEEQTKCYCGHTSYCDCGPQEETKQDQVERMYSEEEVKFIVSEALQSALVTVDLEQWFEQFKKEIKE